MNAPAKIERLPALVQRAADTLANATNYAEVLDARDLADVAYDAAKRAGRIARAKSAHDGLIAAVHRAQADALEIEAKAKRKLADEYDAAQARGEVATAGNNQHDEVVVSSNDLGLRRDELHEARQIRDAEDREPGIVQRAIEARLNAGEAPTKADVRRAVTPVPQSDGTTADIPSGRPVDPFTRDETLEALSFLSRLSKRGLPDHLAALDSLTDEDFAFHGLAVQRSGEWLANLSRAYKARKQRG